MITSWMKLGGNLPLGHDALPFYWQVLPFTLSVYTHIEAYDVSGIFVMFLSMCV